MVLPCLDCQSIRAAPMECPAETEAVNSFSPTTGSERVLDRSRGVRSQISSVCALRAMRLQAVNLKACNTFRMYNGKAAEAEIKVGRLRVWVTWLVQPDSGARGHSYVAWSCSLRPHILLVWVSSDARGLMLRHPACMSLVRRAWRRPAGAPTWRTTSSATTWWCSGGERTRCRWVYLRPVGGWVVCEAGARGWCCGGWGMWGNWQGQGGWCALADSPTSGIACMKQEAQG